MERLFSKKRIGLVLSGILSATIVLTGCGSNTSGSGSPTPKSSSAPSEQAASPMRK